MAAGVSPTTLNKQVIILLKQESLFPVLAKKLDELTFYHYFKLEQQLGYAAAAAAAAVGGGAGTAGGQAMINQGATDPHAAAAAAAAGIHVDLDSATESNHDTALTLACAGGHEDLVTLLLGRGADIGTNSYLFILVKNIFNGLKVLSILSLPSIRDQNLI